MSDDLGFIADDAAPTNDLGFVADEPFYKQAAMEAVDAAGKTLTAPWQLTQALVENPEKVYEKAGPWLPAAGGMIGTAFAPGLGTAIGSGVGELTRQAAGIAFNDPKVTSMVKPGESFSPKAGLNAAAQTFLGGIGDVNGVTQAAPGAKPYVQRGLEYVGDKLRPVGEGIKKMAAKATEVMTGVPARQGVKLIEEPGRLVSGIGQTEARGEAVGAAEEALATKLEGAADAAGSEPLKKYAKTMYGVDLDMSEGGLGIKWSPELDAAITTNKGGVADDIVNNLLVKAKKTPTQITVDEALAGVKSIDRTMPAFTQKNGKIIQRYSDLRSQLSEILEGADPNYANAKAAYHDAMVGASFRHPFRQTKTGQTSAVPFLSFLMNPGNWNTGELAGQAMKLPFFSPVVYGTGLAAGSVATKAAGAVINSPTARQALISRYIAGKSGETR